VGIQLDSTWLDSTFDSYWLCKSNYLFWANDIYNVTKKCDYSFRKLDASFHYLPPQDWCYMKTFSCTFYLNAGSNGISLWNIDYRSATTDCHACTTDIDALEWASYRFVSVQPCDTESQIIRGLSDQKVRWKRRDFRLDNRCQTDPHYLFKHPRRRNLQRRQARFVNCAKFRVNVVK